MAAYPDIDGRCFLTFQCGRSCTSDGAFGICSTLHVDKLQKQMLPWDTQRGSCVQQHTPYVLCNMQSGLCAAQYEAYIELATHEMGVALPFRGHPAYMTQLFQSCYGMYLPTE